MAESVAFVGEGLTPEGVSYRENKRLTQRAPIAKSALGKQREVNGVRREEQRRKLVH